MVWVPLVTVPDFEIFALGLPHRDLPTMSSDSFFAPESILQQHHEEFGATGLVHICV